MYFFKFESSLYKKNGVVFDDDDFFFVDVRYRNSRTAFCVSNTSSRKKVASVLGVKSGDICSINKKYFLKVKERYRKPPRSQIVRTFATSNIMSPSTSTSSSLGSYPTAVVVPETGYLKSFVSKAADFFQMLRDRC